MQVEIYTDGSCDNRTGFGGWCAILMSGDYYKEISGAAKGTTSQRMELQAAIEALKLLKSPSSVTLTSDSQYLVKAFNLGWLYKWWQEDFKVVRGERKNSDQWKELLNLSNEHDITFVHIRGHRGHKWNERCDWLAGSARMKLEKEMGL
jgi:ribonuclease HI